MSRGHLCLLLHAHLPFVRHPEHPEFLEEKWLFEAVAESYLPLLSVFEKLADDRVPFGLTVSLSPTLVAMLDDDLLRKRCHAWLAKRKAGARRKPAFVREQMDGALRDYEQRGGDIVAGFRNLENRGFIEIITTCATHAFLPLLKSDRLSVRAQIRIALDEHERRFGRRPSGFWLPECGFHPDLRHELAQAGITYCVVDAHGFQLARPAAPFGPRAPVRCDDITFFARDPDSAREVWGHGGFPSASVYRDFHATDADGFKTRAVSGTADAKLPYDAAKAEAAVSRHAQEFVVSRIASAGFHNARMEAPPLTVAAYDAELFGHWWHEGPRFVDHVMRYAATRRDEIETLTLSGHLARHQPAFTTVPGASSWGQHGFNDFWLNQANHWIYPELRRASVRFMEACSVRREDPLHGRAIRQAARSLLLSQASDWPFLMARETSAAYAGQRLRDQIARVHFLCDAIERNDIDERKLRALEQMDNLFPEIDCRHFVEIPA